MRFNARATLHVVHDNMATSPASPAMQKVQAIVNPKVAIKFAALGNEALLEVLQRCLQRNPTKRPSIKELLQHPFLSPAPLQSVLFYGIGTGMQSLFNTN